MNSSKQATPLPICIQCFFIHPALSNFSRSKQVTNDSSYFSSISSRVFSSAIEVSPTQVSQHQGANLVGLPNLTLAAPTQENGGFVPKSSIVGLYSTSCCLPSFQVNFCTNIAFLVNCCFANLHWLQVKDRLPNNINDYHCCVARCV